MIKKILKRFLFITYPYYYLNMYTRKLYVSIKKKYLNFKKIPIYYFIGDSHVLIYFYEKQIISEHLGAATAYGLINEESTTQSRKKFFSFLKNINKEKDIIVTSFGEIDCRVHIFNQFKKNEGKIPIEKIIKKTINNYLSAVNEIKNKGYNIIILGIPPAGKQKNIYNYPYYGNEEVRSEINKLFNKLIKEKCSKLKINYIEIFITNKNNLINEEYSDDGVHYNKKIIPLVIKKLKEYE